MFITVCQNAVDNVNDNVVYNLNYYYGDWIQYSNHLTNELKRKSTERERYPACFLITEYEEEPDDKMQETTIGSLTIVLINKTVKSNNKDRYDDEISILKGIMDDFIEQLKLITIDFTYSFKINFDAELETNNVTNQMRLNFNNLIYEQTNC